MQELKPCPFCGGKAEIMDMGFPHWVYCESCGAKVNGRTHDEKDSVEAWNRRTEVARMEYDREELHENCTVHVLWNSETGESSIGWWRNDKPPEVIK